MASPASLLKIAGDGFISWTRLISVVISWRMEAMEWPMPDFLVRDLDPEVYERMRKAAEAQGKSLAQTAREALAEKFNPENQEAWAEADRIRARSEERRVG